MKSTSASHPCQIPLEIIQRFAKREGISVLNANRLGDELVRFLTLCATSTETLAPSPLVDDMWHHFILHTRDYGEWCALHLGKFIHHVPSDGFTLNSGSYERTRILLTGCFGSLSNRYWPRGKARSSCEGCSPDCRSVVVT
jgi:hypothetical protein